MSDKTADPGNITWLKNRRAFHTISSANFFYKLKLEHETTKPFSLREVVARVCAVLRARPRDTQRATLTCDSLVLDSATNRVTAGSDTQVKMERLPGSRQLLISGTVAAGATYWDGIAIDDPARFAAAALADALERRGVSIRGGIATRSRGADEAPDPANAPVVLAKHVSGPLPEILLVIDKISHNLYAELVLREVGRAVNGTGTRQAGISEVYKLIWETGVRTECCYFQDGSGLSRQTLISPLSTAKLLEYMYQSKYHDIWRTLLPIGGVDGSLGRRFNKNPEARRIRAKTGSIAHVATISGYAESTTWGPLAFSVLINNFNAENSEAAQLLDRIALALLE